MMDSDISCVLSRITTVILRASDASREVKENLASRQARRLNIDVICFVRRWGCGRDRAFGDNS